MRIGVLTGGGDCPGLNAVIRAVVRLSTDRGHEMVGVRDGWKGLTDGIFTPLGRREVSGILPRGGTILGMAMTPRLATKPNGTFHVSRMNATPISPSGAVSSTMNVFWKLCSWIISSVRTVITMIGMTATIEFSPLALSWIAPAISIR